MSNYARPPLLEIPPTPHQSLLALWSQTNSSQPPCTPRVAGIPREPPEAPKPQRKRTFDENTPVRPNEKRRRKNQLDDDTYHQPRKGCSRKAQNAHILHVEP
ncbi:hypothetical protein AZE42_12167 [Rhizopogon vesiculosus]|uniref:Uncharacterized protein n=1 Tax=Rhizopogon vesiculosus TaxID=180088 RepID=A0A1J8R237_9AGAM|nr:hypothetical protein AZE42_12167 [Rhizopogon vesiculosus]